MDVTDSSSAPASRELSGPAGSQPSTPAQSRALGFLALIAMAALFRVALPVGVGLLLGALEAFALQPLYERFRRKWSANTSALLCALGSTTLLAAGIAALGYLFINRGVAIVRMIPSELAPGGSLRTLADRSAGTLVRLHVDPEDLVTRLQGEAISLGSRAAGLAAVAAKSSLSALLSMLFMTMMSYLVLRHWSGIVARAEILLPFNPRHTRNLLAGLRVVGRHVLLGTVSTGLVQGLLAAAGYWMTGLPEPAFFGALTAVASLVPVVGTVLVWGPLGVFLIATGHPVAGLLELAYGTLVVGIVSDYVIRPRLVGSDRGVPTTLTLVALFGGVEVFGLIGLLLGPVIVSLSVAILRTYEENASELRLLAREPACPSTVVFPRACATNPSAQPAGSRGTGSGT